MKLPRRMRSVENAKGWKEFWQSCQMFFGYNNFSKMEIDAIMNHINSCYFMGKDIEDFNSFNIVLKEKMETEYGSIGGVRFLDPEYVSMTDADGKEVLCKCGKKASSSIIGKESFQTFCETCSPVSNCAAEFIYKDPHCS